MISNIILCSLFGRGTYLDPDGVCHLPLHCFEYPYDLFEWYTSIDIPEGHLEWAESPPNLQIPICLQDHQIKSNYEFIMNSWTSETKEPRSRDVILLRFKESTQLERVTLHMDKHKYSVVFQENRICSIDFMEFKIYGIFLDPEIQDWVQFSKSLCDASMTERFSKEQTGEYVSQIYPEFWWIEFEAYPYTIPEIRHLTFLPPSMRIKEGRIISS